MPASDNKTRRRILRAALKQFAHRGYAGAPVQTIVNEAKVTKPTLYYYFKSKAGLYQAVLDWAYDERFRVMQEGAGKGGSVRDRLVELLYAVFGLLEENSDLTRIALTTAFASRGEVPADVQYLQKSQRNFNLVSELIKAGAAAGEITSAFPAEDIAVNFYGMMNIHVMGYLFNPKARIDRPRAEEIVQMLFQGVAGKKKGL
jgi:AcrR family transcriptional regulator